jgi:predicted acylesterase/phospholipase RssA
LALTREYLDGALDDAPPSTRLLVTKAAATIAAAMNSGTLRPPSDPKRRRPNFRSLILTARSLLSRIAAALPSHIRQC